MPKYLRRPYFPQQQSIPRTKRLVAPPLRELFRRICGYEPPGRQHLMHSAEQQLSAPRMLNAQPVGTACNPQIEVVRDLGTSFELR